MHSLLELFLIPLSKTWLADLHIPNVHSKRRSNLGDGVLKMGLSTRLVHGRDEFSETLSGVLVGCGLINHDEIAFGGLVKSWNEKLKVA